MHLKSICCAIFAVFTLLGRNVCAEESFAQWKELFYDQALAAGIKKQTLDLYVPQMDLLPKIIEQDVKLPEYIPTFTSYIESRLTQERIDIGRQLAKQHEALLQQISKKYNVPAEYLLALWAMETNYGAFMGNVDILDALASLAYHPRRRTFFTSQLISYLRILERETIPPKVGSWDAGFGHFQFMPGTFEIYAVDGDKDKARDLISSLPDAFASAANYLHQLGWDPANLWGREVIVPQNIDWDATTDKLKKVDEWIALGIKPANLESFPENERSIQAALTAPMGSKGPTFLTYSNFRYIMNWNKYELYALTAGLMADSIAGRFKGFYTQPNGEKIKSEEIQQLQEYLLNMGYHIGNADGKLGKNTKHAIRSVQGKLGLIPDGFPDRQLLNLLTTKKQEEK